MDNDSINEDVLKLRRHAFKILNAKWAEGKYQKDIYNCIDEWISKGHVTTFGIAQYFDAYYTNKHDSKYT